MFFILTKILVFYNFLYNIILVLIIELNILKLVVLKLHVYLNI